MNFLETIGYISIVVHTALLVYFVLDFVYKQGEKSGIQESLKKQKNNNISNDNNKEKAKKILEEKVKKILEDDINYYEDQIDINRKILNEELLKEKFGINNNTKYICEEEIKHYQKRILKTQQELKRLNKTTITQAQAIKMPKQPTMDDIDKNKPNL